MDDGKRTPEKMTYKSIKLLLQVALFFVVVILFFVTLILEQFPSDNEIRGCLTTKLYSVHLCPQSPNYISLGKISPYLQKSIVLTEDSTFWDHGGFDLQELEKSLKTNLQKRKFARGGSTISQQLAKNMFLSKDKTLSRKISEAVITFRIEKVLSKKEILERYLNVVQFGKNLFGIKAAADFYFSKTPSQLSVVEAAFLTFLLPNPEIYSKSFHKKQLTPFARARMNQIIENMYQYGRINEDEFLAAKNEFEHFLSTPAEEITTDLDSINEEDVGESEDY